MLEDLLEEVVVDAEHDLGVHLDEAAIAVPGEARVAGGCGEAPTVASLRPRLRTVSIMPGIETRAPERTETSSGFWRRRTAADRLLDTGQRRRAPASSSSAG